MKGWKMDKVLQSLLGGLVGQIPIVAFLSSLVRAAVFLLVGFLLLMERVPEISQELANAQLWGAALAGVGVINALAFIGTMFAARSNATYRLNTLGMASLSALLVAVAAYLLNAGLAVGQLGFNLNPAPTWGLVVALSLLSLFTVFWFREFLKGRKV